MKQRLQENTEPVAVLVHLEEEQAWALAELCKRFTWDHAVNLSVPHDGGHERDAMLSATGVLRTALADVGYGVR